MVWVESLGQIPPHVQLTSSGTPEVLGNKHGKVTPQLLRLIQSRFGAFLLKKLRLSSEESEISL